MKNARYDWVKRTIALLMLVMMLPLQTVYAASVSVTIGEAKVGEKITFSWTKVSGADHYEYSVRELTSNKLIYDHKEAAVTKRSAYIPAKKVHEGDRFEIWVGAFKSSGKLLCEDKATCVVAAGVPEKLSSPVVTAPSGGDVLTELSYKFTWKSVSGASRYIFALRDLTTDELLKKQSTTKLYCSISTLEWGHEYRMAVGAVPSGADDTSSEIGWTEVLFSVKELTKLKSPVVTAPSEGDVLTDTTYKFTWKSVSGAERYIFAVRDLTTNTQIVNKSTGNLYYSVSELIKGHEYRMAVGAVPEGEGDSSSYIGWTEVRFSVKGSTKLASPVVTAPSEGAVLTDTSYKIQWKSVSGADHYVFALRDLTTNKLITRKTTNALYYNATLTKGHDYRMAVGAVPAGEADDSSYIGWTEVLFSVKKEMTKLASPVVTAPSEGAVLTATSYKIQWKSVSGADHYVFALRDLTTNKLITRKTTDALYYNATLTKGHDYRMAVGAVPAGEADDSVYIGWKEVLFSVKDDIYVNIKADKTSVKVGVGEVTFTITTNAKKVKLFVDGKSYPEDDWKEVTNGQVTYKRKFTSQGSRVVTFRTLSGVESNKLTIKVTAKGKLAKAQITAPETVIVGNAVDVSWAKVKNADQYKVVLYNSAGTTVWTKTTKALNVTIPATKLKKGTYSITVMATGADYTQSESSVSLTVKAKKALADPEVTIPDRVDEGKDLVVAWTAVKNASYYVVKLFDMNVNDYLKQKDPSPIWKKTIKTGVEATIGKDNLEYKQNYTVVVEAHASGYATGETVKGFFVDKEVTITAKADMTTAKVGKDTVTFTITTNGLKVRTYIDGKAVGDWVIVENGKAIVIYVFPTAGEHKVTFKTLNGTVSNEIIINVIEDRKVTPYSGSTYDKKLQEAKTKYKSKTAVTLLLGIARSQIGYKHDAFDAPQNSYRLDGNGNGKAKLKYKYSEYGRYLGINGKEKSDWCASFISWCANEAGIAISVIPKTAGAGTFRSVGTYTRMWSNDFSKSNPNKYKPEKGDIVTFMPWNSDYTYHVNGWNLSSHVAIIESVSEDEDGVYIINIIEGNASGKVGTRTLRVDARYDGGKQKGVCIIQGISHPNYQ